MKNNPCKLCNSEYHTAFRCLQKRRKPMNLESERAKSNRIRTTKAWFAANPPDKNGHWHCYISRHPNCPKVLTIKTLVREHNLSKARRPDLIYDITNIFPACKWDNKAKGSLSAEEYMALPENDIINTLRGN